MNYHNITKCDCLNGEGMRVVLWVAGCSHKCKGCHNQITWDKNSGLQFDENAKQEIYKELSSPYVDGITFSGGDPLFCDNREEVGNLIEEIAQKFPTKTIWLYTGFLWEHIKHLRFIKHIDVLCDGKFEMDKCDASLLWVGSRNQRIIDVKKSLNTEIPVLYIKQ